MKYSIPYKHCLKFFLKHFAHVLVYDRGGKKNCTINELYQHVPNLCGEKMLFLSTFSFSVAFCIFSIVEELVEIGKEK